MPREDKKYYYIEIDIKTKQIIDWGILTPIEMLNYQDRDGKYRIFLTPGQYNKFLRAMSEDKK